MIEIEKPEYLYKYRTINRHTLHMILFSEAYFSLPIEFNDPFDCNIMPDLVYTEEEKEKFISDLIKNGKITHEECNTLSNDTEKIFTDGWKYTFNNIRNNLRVFCLSEVNNNAMMYSHYAESHKGICLEFKVTDDSFWEELEYVHYRNEVPVFHPFHNDMNLIHKELIEIETSIKSCSWSYEKEWRIIKNGPSPIVHKFPSNILSSIIFGYQTPPKDKLFIERIIEKRTPPIQLKEVAKKDKSFELEIIPYQFQVI